MGGAKRQLRGVVLPILHVMIVEQRLGQDLCFGFRFFAKRGGEFVDEASQRLQVGFHADHGASLGHFPLCKHNRVLDGVCGLELVKPAVGTAIDLDFIHEGVGGAGDDELDVAPLGFQLIGGILEGAVGVLRGETTLGAQQDEVAAVLPVLLVIAGENLQSLWPGNPCRTSCRVPGGPADGLLFA